MRKISDTTFGVFIVLFYILLVAVLGRYVWGNQRDFSSLLPIDFGGFGSLGDFVGGIFGTLFAVLAVYVAVLSFKKETVKTRFYEMLKSHKDNVNNIQQPNADVFEKFLLVLSEIYSIAQKEIENSKHKKNELFNLSYLFFFYGTGLSAENAMALQKKIQNNKLISKDDFNSLKNFFSTNNINLQGYSNELGIYFRQLYQTVTFINKQGCLSYSEKYEYIKSLRVCLNVNEQYLLFLNSLSSLGLVWEQSKSKDKEKLITKYNFLKNIPESYKRRFTKLDFEEYYPKINYEYMGDEKEKERKKWEKRYSESFL